MPRFSTGGTPYFLLDGHWYPLSRILNHALRGWQLSPHQALNPDAAARLLEHYPGRAFGIPYDVQIPSRIDQVLY
jgi:hypothetical protein